MKNQTWEYFETQFLEAIGHHLNDEDREAYIKPLKAEIERLTAHAHERARETRAVIDTRSVEQLNRFNEVFDEHAAEIVGAMPWGSVDFVHVVLSMIPLHLEKSLTYDNDATAFSNLRESARLASRERGIEMPPHIGAYLRFRDKLNRIVAFHNGGQYVNDKGETLLNDYRDAAAYLLAEYVLLCEEIGVDPKTGKPKEG